MRFFIHSKKESKAYHTSLRHVHWRFTWVFTGISSLILIVMSVIYLTMSEKELLQNVELSFISESNTILSNLEQQSYIKNSWLAKIAANSSYAIALYDNGSPLNYTKTALSKETQQIAENIHSVYFESLTENITSYTNFSVAQNHFSYQATVKSDYYVTIARIGRSSAALDVIILFSKNALQRQLFMQRVRLFFINVAGVLLLFFFSYFYTGRLLSPIQKAQEKQAAFIASASHELRTPLAVILTSLSAYSKADVAMQTQLLSTVKRESTHMSHLVNDMLTLANADNQSLSFQMKNCELDTLLLDCYESFQLSAKEHQMKLAISLPDDVLPECYCDADRITQVISILLSNAISYSNAIGVIQMGILYSNHQFQITITDHGTGISDSAKEHIFERFYREDSSRSKKDHFGLGLCIAKEIIDKHHGSIHVCDTPGGGATFIILLPEKSI